MKLGGIVLHMDNYNFTKFHQNQTKSNKVLLIAHFSLQNFKVSVELWKSYIVHTSLDVDTPQSNYTYVYITRYFCITHKDFKMLLLKMLFFAQLVCFLSFASPLYPTNRRQFQPMQKIEAEARRLFTGFGKHTHSVWTERRPQNIKI